MCGEYRLALARFHLFDSSKDQQHSSIQGATRPSPALRSPLALCEHPKTIEVRDLSIGQKLMQEGESGLFSRQTIRKKRWKKKKNSVAIFGRDCRL
jgi:hypothetical protein